MSSCHCYGFQFFPKLRFLRIIIQYWSHLNFYSVFIKFCESFEFMLFAYSRASKSSTVTHETIQIFTFEFWKLIFSLVRMTINSDANAKLCARKKVKINRNERSFWKVLQWKWNQRVIKSSKERESEDASITSDWISITRGISQWSISIAPSP